MSQSSPDITIIGGGIVGLWSAHHALAKDLKVHLIEKRTIGAGASGGILGALMPHQPTGWNEKKQFQLDGLLALPDIVSQLEAETGQSCGYAQIGRIQPIRHRQKLTQSDDWAQGSYANWPHPHQWRVMTENPDPHWLTQSEDLVGVNHDTLSARIDPRAYIAALFKSIENKANLTVSLGAQAPDLTQTSAPTIIAAGVGAFDLIEPYWPKTLEKGRGVKGQGALLKPAKPIAPDMPILYDNSTYVIAHEHGLIAIGSTSENEFDAADTTDEKLDALIAHAMQICPTLDGAEIIEKWAGLRPRAPGREPLIGPLPEAPNLIVATGGFKISFAIAHLMADAAVKMAVGERTNLPHVFRPQTRIEALGKQLGKKAG